ncbi:NFX1-type zinc finger-containing protein 1 [Linnemannia schmuckeri]|uniref:NFX1-type zinc finger-containing protein 1 n=1 Tax=Linnemannia schmuckeri TaxID=64567 RepID=A0A9P5RPU8_9FUNG|nr:NFX1-type zinc finger-containing protein 1 [Linnemannia schmuckeri]
MQPLQIQTIEALIGGRTVAGSKKSSSIGSMHHRPQKARPLAKTPRYALGNKTKEHGGRGGGNNNRNHRGVGGGPGGGGRNDKRSQQNQGKPKKIYADVQKPKPMMDISWKNQLPRDNFRFQSVYPTDADINEDYPEPAENIVHKAYDSTEHYLETHFKLLRADCILPVRDAIQSYRYGTVDDNDMTKYINVRPMALLFASIGLVHRMSFIVEGHRVNWRQSKRLIPGAIVCLSVDNFEHFRFATVVERDLEFLQNPRDLRIGIKFIKPDPHLDFDPDVCYTMIESMQGYFEAYQHVLRCLQDIDPSTLPFQPQLVGLEHELESPAYSQHNQRIRDDDYLRESLRKFPMVLKGPAQSISQEPPESSEIQPSVIEAMQRMLTKEFAVVQGPPGTGKTFLGLLTTRMLLEQFSTSTTGAIIVVCQTNHALDQFLEGIMTFEDRIIRLGSRSKSPTVTPRTLYNVRTHYRENQMEAHNDNVINSAPVRFFRMKDKLETDMLVLLEELAVEYVPLSKFLELGIISQEQHDSFSSDEWVSFAEPEEEPTARSWLQSAPYNQDPHDISVFDDASLQDDYVVEIDEEELQERVDEFISGNLDETKMSGNVVNVKPSIVRHLNDATVGDVRPFIGMPNVHDIPGNKRMGVYKIWLQSYQATIIKKLGELNEKFNIIGENIRAGLRANDVNILKTARVIGMTTTAASKYHDLLWALKPKIMICEEASETLEAHIISALTPTVQHLILIGDHEQLRPSMSVDDLKSLNIDVSLFERLVTNHFPYSMLDCQRRMRPEIRRLIRPIYKNLWDHDSVCHYDDVRGMVDNLWFLTHDEPDMVGQNNSHINVHEAGVAAKLAIYLLQQGYDPSLITILTMYSGQRLKILEKLRQSIVSGASDIRVSTVDGFQGEENDIIILSLVRSNSNNSIGFLKTSNRICVGLSRAKKGMYIIGNAQLLKEQSKLWNTIIMSLLHQSHGFKIGNRIKLQCPRHPEMISQVGLEAEFDQVQGGGCSKPCGGVFPDCGHPCPFQCHAGDHDDMFCNHPCGKPLQCGKHFCSGNCSDRCRPCMTCC